MGCGSSKVTEFKGPGDSKQTGQSSSSTAAATAKKDNNKENVTPNVKQTKIETFEPPKSDEAATNADHVVVNNNTQSTAEPGKPPIEQNAHKERKPILGGTLETRETEFNPKLSRIYSPTKLTDQPAKKLTILHFNDVYNIESRDQEPVGGAARFVTKIRSFPDEPLVLFSGDCLNPSLSKI